MQLIRQSELAGLPIRQYMPWATAIQPRRLASFESVVDLVGIEMSALPEPDGTFTIVVYWRPTEQTASPLKIFMHMLGQEINPATNTNLWSQDDQAPQDGRIETTTWQPGLIYRDVYHLPVGDLPAGDIDIVLGLYDPVSGDRVSLPSGGDSYLAGSLSLP
jgi:hypothetical protein